MNNIEILEEFIEQYNASYPEEKEWVAIYPNQIEAIENLIQENKAWKKYATEEVEEEITELNNKNCELEFKIEHLVQENKELKEKQKEYEKQLDLDYVEENYIPKSKVKEKIEDLEKQAEEVKNHYKGTYACLDEYLNAKSKIQGFKELLEEGE